MKYSIPTIAIIAGTFIAPVAFAEAISAISGDISLSGSATLNSAIPTATAFTGFSSEIVGTDTQSGNFLGTDSSLATSSPFTFLSGGVPSKVSTPFTLWTFTSCSTTYTFTADSIDTVQKTVLNASRGLYRMSISGSGTVTITGFKPTPAAFTLTITGGKSSVSFASYATTTP